VEHGVLPVENQATAMKGTCRLVSRDGEMGQLGVRAAVGNGAGTAGAGGVCRKAAIRRRESSARAAHRAAFQGGVAVEGGVELLMPPAPFTPSLPVMVELFTARPAPLWL
jgi:hypothetical protein